MSFVIRYEATAGMGRGHAQRMHRLARALEQWTDVDCRPFDDEEDLAEVSIVRHLVLDLARNDNARLQRVRLSCDRLTVFVGVGHTVDAETAWLADCIIYQNCRTASGLPDGLAKILIGPKWLMTDPDLANTWSGADGNILAFYCGAGWPQDFEWCLRLELSRLLPEVRVLPEFGNIVDNWQRLASQSRMACASMGMAALETIDTGTPTVVFSVDAEHAEDAESAGALGLLTAAPFGSTPEQVARRAAGCWRNPKPPRRDAADGMGLYRVARELLAL